jgi:DNA-binding CsgD family transcriptional regulator
MNLAIFKPNVSSFGYALFLAINATSIWGGGFPLLPFEFQTFNILVIFFLVQSIAFWGFFLLMMAGSYLFPQMARRQPIVIHASLMFVGSICLIAPLYLPGPTVTLVVAGGLMLGIGSAGFFMLWQRVFASQDPDKGNLDLMVGTGFSALIYTLLHVIPIAVATFTIAFVFIPLSALCLILATRDVDFEQPMFEDVPRQNPRVYRQTVKVQWRSALSVGCFGFASGVARAVALDDPSIGLIVNFASMAGALASAIILLALWQRYTFRFDPTLAFRTIFPLIVTLFLLLPFIGTAYIRIFAGIMYMFFAFATMIMMIQCAQASRDHGISPTFIYGFFGAIVYSLQSLGFLAGYLSAPLVDRGFKQLAIIALLALWFLAITLYLLRGRLRSDVAGEPPQANIEFIAPHTDDRRTASAFARPAAPLAAPTRGANRGAAVIRDRYSKKSALIAQRFRLTTREAEVMEMIARGNSVAHIAEALVVPENTIRTHSKRLYVKLGVHKRQDLLNLFDEFDN